MLCEHHPVNCVLNLTQHNTTLSSFHKVIVGINTVEHLAKLRELVISCFLFCFVLFCFKDFIYLFERDRARRAHQHKQGGEGEAGSPVSWEPNMGLDLRTLGS